MTSIVNFVILKADARRQTFKARAVAEEPDSAGEIFCYSSSKPNFQNWSAACHRDSGGKSFGNLRAMHNPIVAGHLTSITFNDTEKAIDVEGKVSDPTEWKKLAAGDYAGLSIGGTYQKKWPVVIGGKTYTKYTANPNEISLVDRPCVRSARVLSLTKIDGSVELVAFKAFLNRLERASIFARTSNRYTREFLAVSKSRKDSQMNDLLKLLETLTTDNAETAALRKNIGDSLTDELIASTHNEVITRLAKRVAAHPEIRDADAQALHRCFKATLQHGATFRTGM